MTDVAWQEQVGVAGCGVASLAMLTGSTYARIVEAAPFFCDAKCGVDEARMLEYLSHAGLATQKKQRLSIDGEKLVKPWPPRPWADLHLCLVWLSKEDFDKDVASWRVDNSHWVVMDGKGVVFDPVDPEATKRRLRDYYRVLSVIAVLPVE